MEDLDLAMKINPGRINTWDPDLSEFYKHGGKMLTFHGGADQVSLSRQKPVCRITPVLMVGCSRYLNVSLSTTTIWCSPTST